MKLRPEERRNRIYSLAEQDEEYRKMKAEFETGKVCFEKIANILPQKLRNRFWIYPGMGHFMHHRMLTLICQNMKFLDEE